MSEHRHAPTIAKASIVVVIGPRVKPVPGRADAVTVVSPEMAVAEPDADEQARTPRITIPTVPVRIPQRVPERIIPAAVEVVVDAHLGVALIFILVLAFLVLCFFTFGDVLFFPRSIFVFFRLYPFASVDPFPIHIYTRSGDLGVAAGQNQS
jgi:hypothetical protein